MATKTKGPTSSNTGIKKASVAGATGSFAVNTGMELLMGAPLTTAVGRGAFMTAWEIASPWTFGAYVGGKMLSGLGSAVNSAAQNTARDIEYSRYNPNARFQNNMGFNPMNQQVATMRQASVQAIQGSKMNARNAIGSEAALMHRAYY